MNIKMPPTALSGQFRMVVSEDAAGERVKHDTGFFDNLITDVGMNRVGTVSTSSLSPAQVFWDLCGRFVVGSGSAVPQFTDTALQNPVAFASANPDLDSQSSNYGRGWYEITVRHQFGQGQAAGNLSEIGIQHSGLSGPLWSRALILDGAGSTTTITVLPDDFLTCYYTLRIMIPQQDAVFNIDVDYDEDGIVPTVVTGRPLGADSSSINSGWGLNPMFTGNINQPLAYSGGLNAPTASNPLGSGIGGNITEATTYVPYVQDSFERFYTITLSLNQLNSSTIRTVIARRMLGYWQVEFNPPLQKDNTQTMQLTFGYSWARA